MTKGDDKENVPIVELLQVESLQARSVMLNRLLLASSFCSSTSQSFLAEGAIYK